MTNETATPYSARPGTLPFRALAHLETLPPGAELTSAKLADAVGAAPSGVLAALSAALTAGAVFKRKKDAHPRSPLFWSLVDHARSSAPALNGATSGAVVVAQPGPRSVPSVPLAGVAGELRCALWSDGTLQIQRGGQDIARFSAAEAEGLLQYLVRHRTGVAHASANA